MKSTKLLVFGVSALLSLLALAMPVQAEEFEYTTPAGGGGGGTNCDGEGCDLQRVYAHWWTCTGAGVYHCEGQIVVREGNRLYTCYVRWLDDDTNSDPYDFGAVILMQACTPAATSIAA